MKTPEQILESFNLTKAATLTSVTLMERLIVLADYVASYEASYEKLSDVLNKRTRKLRALEDRDLLTQQQYERLRIISAAQAQMVAALFYWDAALGSDNEAQAMDDLREAMTAYRYSEAQR